MLTLSPNSCAVASYLGRVLALLAGRRIALTGAGLTTKLVPAVPGNAQTSRMIPPKWLEIEGRPEAKPASPCLQAALHGLSPGICSGTFPLGGVFIYSCACSLICCR